MRQSNFLSSLSESTWRAPEVLPSLSGVKRLGFDTETDGTDWRGQHQAIGWSFATDDGRKFYLPVGHQGGGNLDRGQVIRWMNGELKEKTLVVCSGKTEVQFAKKAGVDLEKLGCKLREVQYQAGLLSDYRRSFKLEDMAQEFLGRGKEELDRTRIWEMPASAVGPYAEVDAELPLAIDSYLQPKIDEEDLNRVLDLENSLIYCVCHMEANGALVDVESMRGWTRETRRRFESIVQLIADKTGLKINPNSSRDLAQLFGVLSLPYSRTEPTPQFPQGQPSFTDEFLKDVKHELVALVREARSLDSLSSKYLMKYAKALYGSILPYQLHQLKADEYGTISGRFSSSKINIQQVFSTKKQIKKFGFAKYLVRSLFVPAPGMLWCRADASQIEFRWFVHYSQSARLIRMYNENPDIDFHQQVGDICKLDDRRLAKDINFGRLYGMGRDKMARKLGLSRAEADLMFEAYNEKFPETRQLMNEVMRVAKDRGYVRTILGRRARFVNGEKLHAALNRVLQGTAADWMKLKLKQVYDERKTLGVTMRFTVHDELDGDVPNVEAARRLKEILEEPTGGIKPRVPMTWDVRTGANWAEAA